MPARANCKCCNQACDNHLLVTCSVCKDKYKHSCVDITTSEVRTLNSNKGYDWTCGGCRAIGMDLKDLNYKNEINDLKAENARNTKHLGFDFEDVVAEACERQKGKITSLFSTSRNLTRPKPTADQIQQDKTAVKEIIDYIAPDLYLTDMIPFRLGTHSGSKKRPTKNSEVVRKILKKSSTLRNSSNYKNVVVSQDRTVKQIEYYKTVKQELIDRKNAGETNIRIIYIYSSSISNVILQTVTAALNDKFNYYDDKIAQLETEIANLKLTNERNVGDTPVEGMHQKTMEQKLDNLQQHIRIIICG
nr:unnamed protein product [Callosobruchus chinensis]CAH7764659.1 unnamed protein product [Callosobruchus chinensis]